MKTYHVGYDKIARVAHVASTSKMLPAGIASLGSFNLVEDVEFDFGAEASMGAQTIFDGVRDRFTHAGEKLTGSVEIMLA